MRKIFHPWGMGKKWTHGIELLSVACGMGPTDAVLWLFSSSHQHLASRVLDPTNSVPFFYPQSLNCFNGQLAQVPKETADAYQLIPTTFLCFGSKSKGCRT